MGSEAVLTLTLGRMRAPPNNLGLTIFTKTPPFTLKHTHTLCHFLLFHRTIKKMSKQKIITEILR